MQVKLFEQLPTSNALEEQINEWLEENTGIKICDIRFSTCGFWAEDSPAIIFAALVLYDW
jgi:hypothetical protein